MWGYYFSPKEFVKNIIGKEDAYKFSLWAFGENYNEEMLNKIPDRWNKLHGKDLMITSDGNVEKDLLKMIEIWEKQKGLS